MRKIREELEFKSKLTTYVARHCQATILMRNGVPISLIKENLGHISITTTDNYLRDFADEDKIRYAELLISF